MMNATTFAGLDVHARSIKAVALDVVTGEVRSATFGYDACAVAEWIRSIDPGARCVYESGVTGFDLQKKLSSLGVDCVIGAVSKMIKPSADRRRKNDRNDAEFLARMLSVGNIVEVWVPDDECEAARDLARALDDAREDLRRQKQRLSKFLLRHGLVFDEKTPSGQRKSNWTGAYWIWIKGISFREKADNDTLAFYVDAVRQAEEDKRRLEKLVADEASRPRWKKRVDSLRCLKGIDVMTAADIVFEAGEVPEREVVRRVARAHPLRALQRGKGRPGRHHQGRQQASEESDGGGGVALPERLAPFEGPGPGPSSRPGCQAACVEGGAAARREARCPAGARGPQEQGERRHRARARVLVLGRGLDGRGGAIGRRKPNEDT